MTGARVPQIDRGYRYSAALIADHGRTYHLAAQLLPAANRRGVSALYGFARIVDDIVDHADDEPLATLTHLDAVLAAFDATVRDGSTGDLVATGKLSQMEADVVAAAADTARRWTIPTEYFTAFGRSMRMDVPGAEDFVNRYRTLEQLRCYTYGSASVIGLQLLPLLGVGDQAPDSPTATAAALLGEAFQLTNFLRDVREDLDRDRIYLPTDELLTFGVDEAHLRRCRAARTTSPQLRRAVAHLIAINRGLYRRATPGIALLPRRIRPAIAAAAASYAEILTVIESPATDIMATRAVVSRRRRLRHAVEALKG
ncbi:phytoene/squalene synthase family protein [Gordonia sp. TBRC 11910]|uniref:Phytoene/squalene synthase family protein n=1 Tax=Gordonia asplenii TaxID=2725283 RepID=A0A848L6V2_9ACTN|nr:phytoene/squalene synthase family protein [Gordonia asplenii]NMO03338.1 phytoene/squalene synthase family protein [Gordonia asplenii]